MVTGKCGTSTGWWTAKEKAYEQRETGENLLHCKKCSISPMKNTEIIRPSAEKRSKPLVQWGWYRWRYCQNKFVTWLISSVNNLLRLPTHQSTLCAEAIVVSLETCLGSEKYFEPTQTTPTVSCCHRLTFVIEQKWCNYAASQKTRFWNWNNHWFKIMMNQWPLDDAIKTSGASFDTSGKRAGKMIVLSDRNIEKVNFTCQCHYGDRCGASSPD